MLEATFVAIRHGAVFSGPRGYISADAIVPERRRFPGFTRKGAVMRFISSLTAAAVLLAGGAGLAGAAAAVPTQDADASMWINRLGWRQMAWCSGAFIHGKPDAGWRPSWLASNYLGCLEHNATGGQMALAQATLVITASGSSSLGVTSAFMGRVQCTALWDLYDVAMRRLDEEDQEAVEARLANDDYRVPLKRDCD